MRSAEGSVQKVGRGKWRVVVGLPRDPETGKRRQRAKRVRVYPALGDVGAPRPRGDDPDEGLTIGLPDFSNGVELKTIYGASSENTISKHIGKSKKKAGLSAIVIDVSENNNPDDAKAIEYVRRSIARHNIKFPIYVLKHDGDISAI